MWSKGLLRFLLRFISRNTSMQQQVWVKLTAFIAGKARQFVVFSCNATWKICRLMKALLVYSQMAFRAPFGVGALFTFFAFILFFLFLAFFFKFDCFWLSFLLFWLFLALFFILTVFGLHYLFAVIFKCYMCYFVCLKTGIPFTEWVKWDNILHTNQTTQIYILL